MHLVINAPTEREYAVNMEIAIMNIALMGILNGKKNIES